MAAQGSTADLDLAVQAIMSATVVDQLDDACLLLIERPATTRR
jgi:hypothetical protein